MTGGHVRDSEINQIPLEIPLEQEHEEIHHWKSTLAALCRPQDQVSTDRSWSRLCSTMRELCPETKWFSVFADSPAVSSAFITSVQTWLETLITSPEWPFPEQVILTSEGRTEPSVKIIFSKDTKKIPFVETPEGITVSPWKDKYSAGWKVSASEAYVVNKAGEA